MTIIGHFLYKSPRLKKYYTILISVIFGLMLNGCSSLLHVYFKDTAKIKEGIVPVKGIRKPVIIKRDALGIPYIKAENFEDLAFAIGYVNGVDRLSQIVSFKLMSQGRLSEMMGIGGLEIDMYMRALNLKKISRILYDASSDKVKNVLKKYSEGLNTYMAENMDNLPPDLQLAGYTPERWKPTDTTCLFALLNLGLGFNFHEEINALNIIQRLGPKKAAWLFPIYPDEEIPFEEASKLEGLDLKGSSESLEKLQALQLKVLDFTSLGVSASNNWAVSKQRTSGRASILANDTHLPLSLPSLWQMMHVRCPDYEVAGFGLPGAPAIAAGFNGHLAWGMTMVMADNQDIFLEKLKVINNKLHYLYKGKWIPTIEREEIFNIKGQKPVTHVIHETLHGPIMNEVVQKDRKHMLTVLPVDLPLGIALSWTAFEKDKTIDAFLNIGLARSVEEARPVVKTIRTLPLNVLFADRDNIAWQVTGRYPLRKKGRGLLPSPGWNGDYDWKGYLSVDSHPYAVNPPEGFLATANNRTIDADAAILLSSSWHYPDRIERINQLLAASDKHTIEKSINMQYDVSSVYVPKLKNVLFATTLFEAIQKEIDSWDSRRRREKAEEAISMIKDFNGNMLADSPKAAIIGALLYSYTHNTFLDELGPVDTIAWQAFLDNSGLCYSAILDHILYRNDDNPFWDDIATPERESKAQILARSLADAIDILKDSMGKNRDNWRWGKLHTYHFKTETTGMAKHMGRLTAIAMKFISPFFNRGPFPAGGDYTTINVAGYHLGKDFDVWLIPEMRMIVDFSLEEPMIAVNSTGQSDNPISPHYEDGIHAWLEGKYKSFPFKNKNIDKIYNREILTLHPCRQ